jgi:hypothetical protein
MFTDHRLLQTLCNPKGQDSIQTVPGAFLAQSTACIEDSPCSYATCWIFQGNESSVMQ